ncbi:hypothetical protein [Streptomyces sp. SP18CM02]|uniref:hypothetical protein n=1 Tax=Streptomyces sp. SP18CM02 TaxID=2758571 RepID=UPI00168BDCCA|nr:hypothetical protein [Streptomyces sp. SP18CM02]MBD3550826.1 hypothetical protein [Streptomyces sp. SP18CM02]
MPESPLDAAVAYFEDRYVNQFFGHEIAAQLRRLADEAKPVEPTRLALVEALVSDFIDPDPCHFDHHGYCQAHGWFATDPGCPHGRAKALGLEEPEEDDS